MNQIKVRRGVSPPANQNALVSPKFNTSHHFCALKQFEEGSIHLLSGHHSKTQCYWLFTGS